MIESDEAREERAKRPTVPVPAGRPSRAPGSGIVTIPPAPLPSVPSFVEEAGDAEADSTG